MDRQDKQQIARIAVNVLIEVVVLVILGVVLWTTSNNAALVNQRGNAALKLETAREHIDVAEDDAELVINGFDESRQAELDTLAYFFGRNDPAEAVVEAMAEQWGLEGLYLLDENGTVVTEAGLAAPDFSSEQFAPLASGTSMVVDGSLHYYTSAVDSATTLVGAVDATSAQDEAAQITSLSETIGSISVGEGGYLMAIDEDGAIAYDRDASLVGASAAQVFSTVPVAGFDGYSDLNGTTYYVKAAQIDSYTVCTMVPKSEFDNSSRQKVVTVLVAFGVISALIVCYCQFLYTDARRRHMLGDEVEEGAFIPLGKRMVFNKAFAKKSLPIAVIGALAVFAVSWYSQTLVSLSSQILHNENKMADIVETLEGAQSEVDALTQTYSDEYVRLAEGISKLLAQDTRLIDDINLERMAETAHLESIFVFDENGKSIATSSNNKDFALPEDESDQSYDFWNVVNGEEPYHVQNVVWDGGVTFYAGVTRYDAPGMVEIGVSSTDLGERLAATELTHQLDAIPVGNGGFLVAVDGENSNVSFIDDARWIGQPSSSRGITAAALSDGYLGYQKIDGQNCLVSTCYAEGQYVLVCIPASGIGEGDLPNAALTALLGLVLLVPVVLQLVIQRRGGSSAVRVNTYEDGLLPQPKGTFDITTSRGTTRRVEAVSSRWGAGESEAWADRTPEGKMFAVIRGLSLVITLVLLVYVYGFQSQDEYSALSYVVSMQWEKVPNIFSLSYIGLVVLTAFVGLWAVRKLLGLVARNMSARLETTCKLVNSFVKYAVVIAVLFYTLSLVGVDSASLWASAGIVTLVVGLGAQSLIKDIIAGVFIVFEGDFRVGDIVTVGSWSGTVLEIGIRTTKIEDGSGNIKIFANSSIVDVVNMTKKYSYATLDLAVSYETPLERVEALFATELPKVAERLPKIVAGPYYKGVVKVGSRSLVVRIIAQCRENDRGQLTRDLTREVLLICDHHEIAPYRGACELDEEETSVTPQEQEAAAEFVRDQKGLTKGVDLGEHPSDMG